MRTYWREPGYWGWWWRERVAGHTKVGLAALLAIGVGIAGYLSAERLATSSGPATLTTERVVTVEGGPSGGTESDAGAPTRRLETVMQTVTGPGEREIVTVRRDGKTLVVRTPGETVTRVITSPAPVRDRAAPGARTETVVRTERETLPSPTVTERNEVTVTDQVTVRQEVTVTDEVTVTEQVTVTVTGPSGE